MIRAVLLTVSMMTTWYGVAPAGDVSSVENAEKPTPGQDVRPPLSFESLRHEGIREGYVTLKWNTVSGAARYRVVDSDGQRVYEGFINEAFVSGLSDGTYRYRVEALADDGAVIATSKQPTTVIVRHWLLRDALVLFFVGLIVVLSVALVLWRGSSKNSLHEKSLS